MKKLHLRNFPAVALFCVAFFSGGFALAGQGAGEAEQNPALGELRLQGEGIERLVLQTGDKSKTIEQPGQSIMLEPGVYEVKQVHLKGGFTHYNFREPQITPVQVGPGAPASVKAGGPLRQVVKVQRRGKMLVMDYQLIGAGGEWYRVSGGQRPSFTVYKGDKKIASGKFEFG
jgi:hypothetical protein